MKRTVGCLLLVSWHDQFLVLGRNSLRDRNSMYLRVCRQWSGGPRGYGTNRPHQCNWYAVLDAPTTVGVGH
jgi:hypothetical protein